MAGISPLLFDDGLCLIAASLGCRLDTKASAWPSCNLWFIFSSFLIDCGIEALISLRIIEALLLCSMIERIGL
jgi:hypothetical protein